MSKTSKAILKIIYKTTITQPKTLRSVNSNMVRCNKPAMTKMKHSKFFKYKSIQINMLILETLETKTP
jgi:hypothetical protein